MSRTEPGDTLTGPAIQLQYRTLFYTGAKRTIPHVLYVPCFVYNCNGVVYFVQKTGAPAFFFFPSSPLVFSPVPVMALGMWEGSLVWDQCPIHSLINTSGGAGTPCWLCSRDVTGQHPAGFIPVLTRPQGHGVTVLQTLPVPKGDRMELSSRGSKITARSGSPVPT